MHCECCYASGVAPSVQKTAGSSRGRFRFDPSCTVIQKHWTRRVLYCYCTESTRSVLIPRMFTGGGTAEVVLLTPIQNSKSFFILHCCLWSGQQLQSSVNFWRTPLSVFCLRFALQSVKKGAKTVPWGPPTLQLSLPDTVPGSHKTVACLWDSRGSTLSDGGVMWLGILVVQMLTIK